MKKKNKMIVDMISSYVFQGNKMCIGFNYELLFKIKKDLQFFKKITQNKIVIMGKKTWDSLPNKPLINRHNVVLTSQYLISSCPNVEFMNFEQCCKKYKDDNSGNIIVIGGGEIYKLFLNSNHVRNVYLTEIKTKKKICSNVYFPFLTEDFKLVYFSEKYTDLEQNTSFRFLKYTRDSTYYNKVEKEYNTLAQKLLTFGKIRDNRTNTQTCSMFGACMEFDISDWRLPIMTTRPISFKCIVEELLWFCKGYTNANYLNDRGVKIWNDNSSIEFLKSRNLNYSKGVLGPVYGWNWRHFGFLYDEKLSTSDQKFGYDQLEYIENTLKNDPYSRRIFLTAWDPSIRDKMALEPCHGFLQFYVDFENSEKILNCYFTMRSSDNIAWSYNVVSYTILLYIFCIKCDMKPGKIIYNSVDCHVYTNNIDALLEQITKNPCPLPFIEIDNSIKNKDWKDINFEDFEIIGYTPHKCSSMKMAI